MSITEDYTPRYVGDLSRPLLIYLTDHEGNVDMLTGATNFVMRFRNRSTDVVSTGQGSFSGLNTTNGTIQYNWASADVSTAGFFDFQVSATLTDGQAHWDSRVIEFRAVL